MDSINIHQAKTHLSRLIERAAAGESIIIAKAGKPMAKLVPFQAAAEPREPGYWRGRVKMAVDFDVLPGDIAAAFRGEGE